MGIYWIAGCRLEDFPQEALCVHIRMRSGAQTDLMVRCKVRVRARVLRVTGQGRCLEHRPRETLVQL